MDKIDLARRFAQKHSMSVRETDAFVAFIKAVGEAGSENDVTAAVAKEMGCSRPEVAINWIGKCRTKAKAKDRADLMRMFSEFWMAEERRLSDAAQNLLVLYAEDDDMFYRNVHDAAQKVIGSVNNLKRVHNGRELMNELEEGKRTGRRPHLILLDLVMPQLDGFSCIEKIRKDPELCDIPIVVFSSTQNTDDIRKSYSLGANTFLTKVNNQPGVEKIFERVLEYWGTASILPSKKA